MTFVLSILLLYTHPSTVPLLANVFGIFAAVLACIQYLPQLYTTFRLRAVESLSIPMMCIQTPGSFVWAGSLAARLGAEGWSAWGVYLVTGCLQGALLGLAIYLELLGGSERIRLDHASLSADSTEGNGNGAGHVRGEDEAENADERTALLPDRR